MSSSRECAVRPTRQVDRFSAAESESEISAAESSATRDADVSKRDDDVSRREDDDVSIGIGSAQWSRTAMSD